jgi:hypothetical protein
MGRRSARIRRSSEPPVQAVICGSPLHSQRCGERFMNIQHYKQRLLDLEKTPSDRGCRLPEAVWATKRQTRAELSEKCLEALGLRSAQSRRGLT